MEPKEVAQSEPDNVDLLQADIDIRMKGLWAELWEDDREDWSIGHMGAFMRAAYGLGYCDALKEEALGERGTLCKTHGYHIP